MLSQSHRKIRRRETGSTLVLLSIFIVALFAFAALSIDVANVLHQQRNAQAGTDAAAFAATLLLTNVPPAANAAIIKAAEDIAVANKVTVGEIQASNAGTIQVGRWDGTNFVAGASNVNAVRVPAKRNVPLVFGKVVGADAMNPATYSIAALDVLGCLTNVIPFGVTEAELIAAGVDTESVYELNDLAVGSGKQGKLDLANRYQNTGSWVSDMVTDGFPGQTCVGPIPTITGNAQVAQTFNTIAGRTFSMPVVNEFDLTGKKPAFIVGFITVKLLDSSGTGSKWTAHVQFKSRLGSGPGGGTCSTPVCNKTRTLVQ